MTDLIRREGAGLRGEVWVLLIPLIFTVDYLTGPEIGFSIFYLIPIGLLTWQVSRTFGLLASGLSAVAWLTADLAAGAVYSNDWIPFWNMGVRLGFFLIVTLMLDARRRTEHELELAKREAEAAARVKTDFLNRVTHELRTPLTSILGFANVLRTRSAPLLTHDDQICIDRITTNASHLVRLVDDVLDLGRVEHAKFTVSSEMVDLSRLVTDLARDMHQHHARPGVQLVLDVPEVNAVTTDARAVRQILMNLLSNAFKFTATGHVAVRLHANGDHEAKAIVVEDTGPGIASDRVEAIFAPFEQAGPHVHRAFGGAGLGLTIARELAGLLGYQLRADSENGKGSRFVVELA